MDQAGRRLLGRGAPRADRYRRLVPDALLCDQCGAYRARVLGGTISGWVSPVLDHEMASRPRNRHAKSADSAGAPVVVVTGAARGIGEAITRQLSRRGARVALGDINFDRAERLAAELPGAIAYALDVCSPASVARMMDAVRSDLGPVDVLINNAAVMALGPFVEVAEEKIRTQVETNLMGVIHGMRLALPGMITRGRGHVINVNSSAGVWGVPGENAYVATKFATRGLSELARRELRGTGVHVTVVHFGPTTETELALGM